MNIVNVTPFYNYYEDMRHKSKIKIYIENDDDDDDEANDDNCYDYGKSAMICIYKCGIYYVSVRNN